MLTYAALSTSGYRMWITCGQDSLNFNEPSTVFVRIGGAKSTMTSHPHSTLKGQHNGRLQRMEESSNLEHLPLVGKR